MFVSYYDESAVDGSGPISVVAGLVLNHKQYAWLDIEWKRALERHCLGYDFIHMKSFGSHGDLAKFPWDGRTRLFTELAKIINDNKEFSIGSTLTPENYQKHFSFLERHENLSIHSACFLQAAIMQAKLAANADYGHDIPFLLDQGCPDRKDIEKAHSFLVRTFPEYQPDFSTHAGPLMWEDDKRFPSLQAADIIAWVVRRRESGSQFRNGFEPLSTILDIRHEQSHLEEEWIIEIAESLHVKLRR